MIEPGYTNRPTLLYLYQGLIQQRRISGSGTLLPPLQSADAAEQLTAEIKTGRLEVLPALPPDWRLLPRPNNQLVVKGKASNAQNATEFYCRAVMPISVVPEPWSRPPRAKSTRTKPARPKPARATSKLADNDNVKKVAHLLKDYSLKKAEEKLWDTFRGLIPGLKHREFRAGVKRAREQSAKR